jgi:hypothetical protein
MSNNFETPPADDGMIGPIQDMIHTLGGTNAPERPSVEAPTASDSASQTETPWYRNSPWYSDGEFWHEMQRRLQLPQEVEGASSTRKNESLSDGTGRFLPFRQIFDGVQTPPSPTEQKAVGALFDDVVDTYLRIKAEIRNLPGVEEDTVNKAYEGEHIEVTISDGANRCKMISIRKLGTKGVQRGTIQDFATYFMRDGIVRRGDRQVGRDLSNKKLFDQPENDIIKTAADPVREATDALMALGDFSYMDDLERLGLNNQPIGREELHALLKYINDLFTYGEKTGVIY